MADGERVWMLPQHKAIAKDGLLWNRAAYPGVCCISPGLPSREGPIRALLPGESQNTTCLRSGDAPQAKDRACSLPHRLVLFQLSCSAEQCELSWRVLHTLQEICQPVPRCVPAAMAVSSSL